MKVFIFILFTLSSLAFGKFERKILIDFDKLNSGHPFDVVEDANRNKIGTFKPHEYYNFKLKDLNVKNWDYFDRIELDIFNPNHVSTQLFFTLQDEATKDYWTQINHVQSISPGWNRLSLSLHQMVGERGSVKVSRYLNLNKLKKIFIVVDPDKKSELSDISFKIDNVSVVKEDKIEKNKDILAFDFSDVDRNVAPFVCVTDKTQYSDNLGYGFTDIKLYRNEDSKNASTVLRSTISVFNSNFKVKVPNGKYRFQLIMDQQGYWDVPFYKERMVYVNGKPIYKEIRNNGNEFLKDLLRFENINPNNSSDPYELYIKPIFNKIESEVDVKNGELNFNTSGDEMAVSLNSLIIWKADQQSLASDFLNKIENKYKDEFELNARKILTPKIPVNTPLVSIIKADGDLSISVPRPVLDQKIKLFSSVDEKDFAYIQIFGRKNFKDAKLSLEDIVDSKGNKVKNAIFKIYQLANQFVSPDLNHETYKIAARISKEYDGKKIELEQNSLNYFVIELKNINGNGEFKSNLKVELNNTTIFFPVEIKLSSIKLDMINFPVGFMSLDPLPFSYFKGNDYEEIRKKYRFKALKELAESGFTTFTGLPEVKVSVQGRKLNFDFRDLDETLNQISQYPQFKTIFTYAGQFPNKLMNLEYLPYDMKADEYHRQVSEAIKPYFDSKKKIKIVHTYSDEPSGYNDRVSQDLEKAKLYKNVYSFINIGGFTQFGNKETNKLNSMFDYAFYPFLTLDQANSLKYNGKSFGLYNTSQGALDDPRFSFGIGLYSARKAGLGYYLEWNSIGFNDYPYNDFDGRESDIVAFYPTSKGEILPSLRFLLASEGLNIFRKLNTLENLVNANKLSATNKKMVEDFLAKTRRTNYFFSDPQFMTLKNRPYYEFKDELNEIFYQISINK